LHPVTARGWGNGLWSQSHDLDDDAGEAHKIQRLGGVLPAAQASKNDVIS
jgi:hypothetical protein